MEFKLDITTKISSNKTTLFYVVAVDIATQSPKHKTNCFVFSIDQRNYFVKFFFLSDFVTKSLLFSVLYCILMSIGFAHANATNCCASMPIKASHPFQPVSLKLLKPFETEKI